MNRKFWQGKRVFLTGHTGFKGSWLALWLQQMGANVYGYALPSPTSPNFFTVSCVEEGMASHTTADIRDSFILTDAMKTAKPDIVVHMAAQSLVRCSYERPKETYEVNVMGTLNLLEAVRVTPGIRAVINVTSDKCYENHEWVWGYRENEPLGGYDPYSSSKACAEIVTNAWRRSYLQKDGVALASVRAGNVIGGGDWAEDRLIPDFVRALVGDQKITIRSPQAVRPWQHVLDPLAGYLTLAEYLFYNGHDYSEAWNFGPNENSCRSVAWVVDYLCSKCPSVSLKCYDDDPLHEATFLKLDSSKAMARLNWRQCWDLQTALDETIKWYLSWKGGENLKDYSLKQICSFETEEGGL